MNVLITGARGFIGRNLREFFHLEKSYRIFHPSSKELDLLKSVDVENYLEQNKIDLVIHTATWNATRTSDKDLHMVMENNLRMFYNIARRNGHFNKMIYYGSGAEFGREHWKPKMREDYFDSHVPSDQYGFSKYVMNKHAEKSDNIYNLRLFGVFGRYEDWRIRFISNACCNAILDKTVTINQNVFFDYLYIDDLINITGWFMKNNTDEKSYNVCTGKSYDLKTLADTVIGISGKNLDIKVLREGLGNEYSGDNSKLLSVLGVYSFCDLSKSIKNLYEWYCMQEQEIRKNYQGISH